MRAMPNMTVVAPGDAVEAAKLAFAAAAYPGPVYLRLTRDPAPVVFADDHDFRIGKAVVVREGTDVTIITTGLMLGRAVEAADSLASDGISAHILHVATLKPLDEAAIVAAAEKTAWSSRRRSTPSSAASAAPWRRPSASTPPPS